MTTENGYPLYAIRNRDYPEPPEALWARIMDHRAHPIGAGDVSEVKDEAEGVWIETQPTVITTVEILESAAPTRLVRRLSDAEGLMAGDETLTIAATETGCRVEVARDLRVRRGVKGWIAQKMARAFAGVGAGIANYLETLDPPEEEEPAP